MSQLSEQQLQQLTGSDLCFIHDHPKLIMGFQERLELMEATPVTEVDNDYTITNRDEVILVDTTVSSYSIELPRAERGREFTIVKKVGANSLTINTNTPDIIFGSGGSVVLTAAYSVIRLKSITGGYLSL